MKAFWSNFRFLFVGNLSAQVINFLGLSLLTHYYAPDAFAALAQMSTGALFLSTLLNGQLFYVIVTEEKEENSKMLTLGLLIITGLGILGLLLGTFFWYWATWQDSTFVFAMLFYTFFFSSWQILSYGLNRLQAFQSIGKGQFLLAIASILASYSAFFIHPKYGFLYGWVIGQAVQTGYYFFIWKTKTHFSPSNVFSFLSFFALIKKHHSFLLYRLPHALTDFAKNWCLLLIMEHYYEGRLLGLYVLADRVLGVPIRLVANTISDLYFRQVALWVTENNHKQIYATYIQYLKRSLLLTLPFFPFIIVLGSWGFGFIFGAAWSDAGNYANILYLGMVMTFFLAPSNLLPMLYQQQGPFFKIIFVFSIFYLCVLYAFAFWKIDFTLFLILKTGLEMGNGVLLLFWFLSLTKKYD